MGWADPDSWATRLFSGDPLVILVALLVTFTFPALLHLYFYTQSARAKVTPTFLLLGASGAGKTSLVSLLQKRSATPEDPEASPTRTSQISSTVSLLLDASVPLGSNKYRSENDAVLSRKEGTRYLMVDTPGHGKLRLEQGLSRISDPGIRGIVFVVDATVLDSGDSSALRDTASYLHDVLLALQRRKTGKNASSSKSNSNIPVLIAANKQDLFTALPTGAVRDRLQAEIERVRVSRTKGLGTVGQDPDAGADMDEDVLGGGGEDKFTFKLLNEEYEIAIDVLGGAVKGEEAGKGVTRWEGWIGGCL